MWQAHKCYTIKYKCDHDRMLLGSGSVPATGWMPVGEKFRTIAQGVSKQVFKLGVNI